MLTVVFAKGVGTVFWGAAVGSIFGGQGDPCKDAVEPTMKYC